MLTFKQKFELENDWKQKVLLIQLFHLRKLMENKDWRIVDTADYFQKSKALISENLLLAENFEAVESFDTRDSALKFLRALL